MKKSMLVFLVSIMVIAAVAFWLTSAKTSLNLSEVIKTGIIIVLAGLGIYAGTRRLVSRKHGEPAEDELSRKIMQKTSSLSYYVSLYLWLAVGFISDRTKLETHTLIGAGILGMAVVFLGCWIFFKARGIKDA